MKTAYRKLVKFSNVGRAYIAEKPEKTKVEYALTKMLNRIQSEAEKYAELQEDILLEHAYEDEKGRVVRDERGAYFYTKEGEKAKNKALRDLANQETGEIEPHFVKIPNGFNESLVEAFTGFIFENNNDFENEQGGE